MSVATGLCAERDGRSEVGASRLLHARLDTAVWDAACARMLENGIEEAGARPVED